MANYSRRRRGSAWPKLLLLLALAGAAGFGLRHQIAGKGASVQVPFIAEFKTIRVGSFQENNSVPLVLEDGDWRVDWQPSLFFKDLGTSDLVRLFPLDPRRGSISDRKGRPLAVMGFR